MQQNMYLNICLFNWPQIVERTDEVEDWDEEGSTDTVSQLTLTIKAISMF